MLGNLELTASAPLSLNALIINLLIGTVLSMALRWHFKRFSSVVTNRSQLSQVLTFITLTTILIITIVKSSLALSLGLVGALSIVRFRTPIKEPEELAYLFMAIAIGLGLGADQTIPTIVAATLIMALLGGLRWKKMHALATRSLYLSIDWQNEGNGELSPDQYLKRLNDVISRHVTSSDIRRFDTRNQAGEAVYHLDIEGSEELSRLMSELQTEFPNAGVTFIEQNPALAT